MKKIITLILLLISIISIGQTISISQKIKDLNDLYGKRKFQKVELLSKEILNNQYGNPSNEEKSTTLALLSSILIWDDYENKNYESGYNYTLELLDLWKNGMDSFPEKDANIQKITNLISDLEKKHPELKTIKVITSKSAETSSTTKTDITETKVSETNKPLSDDKTVTLTVSGTGKTLEEARLNALRSAIEQAFGAFISSKTEILNDNLVKDEIVSVASGNVQKFDIVSQIEIPNIGFGITINATVSIAKLTSYAESKGVVVEFKGGMFGANIKLQKLNENSEFVAIKNLLSQTFDMLENSIDYSLNVKEPILIADDIYTIGLEVIENKNLNYDNCMNYLIKTLSKISLSDNEANEITKNGKDLCYLSINRQYLRFRNEKSINALFNFSLISSMIAPNTFCIKNNFGIVKIPSNRARIFSSFVNYYSVDINSKIDFTTELITKPEQVDVNGISFIEYIKKNGFHIEQLLDSNLIASEYNTIIRKDKFLQLVPNFNYSIKYPKDGVNLSYKLNYRLSDIERIESFQIEKIPFSESLLKRESYRKIEERETFGCFLKGTKIRTQQGTKLIENIKIGDEVICFDDKGELHTSIVESINTHENQDVYKYSVWNGETLYATPNHWVLTSENSFTEIGKLNELLTLVDINGGLKPITKVEYFAKETVYNFIVKDYHTYIANDIRVHNGGKGKFKQKNN